MLRYGGAGRALRILTAAAVLVGCAGGGLTRLPPVATPDSDEILVGKFVWFDLLTEDVEAARDFYSDVFDWSFEKTDAAGYSLIRNDGTAIAGAYAIGDRDPGTAESLWLVTLSVEDVDRATSLVKQRGGKVVDRPVDVEGRGRMAVVQDPAGAPLVLLRAAGGDPPDVTAATGGFLWADLWTPQAATAMEFYAALVGYQAQDVRYGDDHVYHVLGRDGRARAGLVEVAWPQLEPNWLPYVRVADMDATLRKVRIAGGSVILRVGDVAILADPSGAALGVQRNRRLERRASR